MKWRTIYYAFEDDITRIVIERVLSYCGVSCENLKQMPARGGRTKSKEVIGSLNTLAAACPAILLIDLDANDCAPQLKDKLMNGLTKNDWFIFNVAVDEAESWLMADRQGFASYFGIDLKDVPDFSPKRQGGRHTLSEIDAPYKTSLYFTHEMMPKSNNKELIAQLKAEGDRCKGKEYNSGMAPFVKDVWNIETARKNSDSLNRMIGRVMALV